MPSPFPGMDPYLEDYLWPGFHQEFMVAIKQDLVNKLPEGLYAHVEVNTISDFMLVDRRAQYKPDMTVYTTGRAGDSGLLEDSGGVATSTPPTGVDKERIEAEFKLLTIEITRIKDSRLIAAIEMLSPVNKRKPHINKYREKRRNYISCGIHFIEIDLLVKGTRPYYPTHWPESTYLVQLADAHKESLFYWAVQLADRLPTIPIPLLPGMDPVLVDLQENFTRTYTNARYDKALAYQKPPPVTFTRQEELALLTELEHKI